MSEARDESNDGGSRSGRGRRRGLERPKREVEDASSMFDRLTERVKAFREPTARKNREEKEERKRADSDEDSAGGDDEDVELQRSIDHVSVKRAVSVQEERARRGRRKRGGAGDEGAGAGEGDGKQTEEDVERERQTEERKKKAESDEDKIYTDHISQSREKWTGLWGAFKVFVYFLMLVSGIFIIQFDYQSRPCITGTLGSGNELCLMRNKTHECVGYETSSVNDPNAETPCRDACGLSFGLDGGEGCLKTLPVTSQDTATYTCYAKAEFESICRDRFTCSSSSRGDVENAVLLVVFLLLFVFIIELLMTAGLFVFAGWDMDQFAEDAYTRLQRVLLFAVKRGRYFTQILWALMMLALLYQIFIQATSGYDCVDALTIAGTKDQFYSDTLMYVVAIGITLGESPLLVPRARAAHRAA